MDQSGGSSPLTRGKREGPGPLWGRGRLIPAHAGKTPGWPRGPPSAPAHPRSRGENLMPSQTLETICGSSPLTRGKQSLSTWAKDVARLIPAHAGKTSTPAAPHTPRPAHPRSRGENPAKTEPRKSTSGSSPLTRGKRQGRVEYSLRVRLIPAHAGKTTPSISRCFSYQAHPRSRGENLDNPEGWPEWLGSSPLTRGKRDHH